MRHGEDIQITVPVPFLEKGTALFVGNGTIRSHSVWNGRRLLSLEDLVRSFTPELCQYLFPGGDSHLSVEEMCRRVRSLAGIGNQTGLLYRKQGILYFHPFPDASDDELAANIEADLSLLYEEDKMAPTGQARERRKACFRRKSAKPEICFSISGRDESVEIAEEGAPDPRVQAILEAWSKIEREFGITIEDMQVLLDYKVKLSRLRITTAGKLFLTDFDNQEVKMDDLTKALYFFYLRHPEGARLKELCEHEDEILHIYSGITGRDDPEKIRESVRNLLYPFGNSLNVSISRIKKAFKDVVSDRIARFYYVYGRSGEIRTISLDRDLVIWEH